MNRCIISDVWYQIDGKDFFIYDWPESCKSMFLDMFKLIKKLEK